ncbi:Hypothetical protein FKW44_000345, partial [Caligus rogercresseyi]
SKRGHLNGSRSAPPALNFPLNSSRIKEETDGSQLLRQLRRDLPALSPDEDLRHRGRVQDVMNMFKEIQGKQPEMAKRDWFFHFDNAPCHKANSTKEFLARR